ncbi:MAG: hypothetical protein COX57_05225 [Alphaproteobacteria bacterium CG_4_10_14_0_2_um_filter_63_37]|nr:MAG: hypothetical protein COX57_05225 [Alphaproteobacteria bacterium CG_4_10_14_0_2_um_filter_63_37]
MREEVFEFRQDKRGAWLYGVMYISIILLSLYFAAIQHYSGGTVLFYVFMFSAWYALFSGFNVVFATQMRILPHSVVRLVVQESSVEVVRKGRSSLTMAPPFEVVRQGGVLRLSGKNQDGKQSRISLEQGGDGGREFLDGLEKSLRRLHRRAANRANESKEGSAALSGP